jgi:hypothetical protein
VFLVGVGSSIPDYDDKSNHVRLGDIVVSVPTGICKDQYIQRQKLEYLHHNVCFSFKITLVRRRMFEFYDCVIQIGIKQAVSVNKRTMEIRGMEAI